MENKNKPAVPSLFEWAGGMPVFEKLFDQFYDKVLADDALICLCPYGDREFPGAHTRG
jgi:truncated hemoglobin YjbI